ncbi:acyl-CoA dehydrogenase family protein [Nocardia sp. NPDC024068]|uniref:acyl-CoA dehydrogenase family protein n=1 Tax=Nocardia sp. NPDC024068 TaxID=3157197 RepID=UPI0033D62295
MTATLHPRTTAAGETVPVPYDSAQLRAATEPTERRRMLLANLGAITDELAAGAETSDAERSLSDRSADALRRAGVLGLMVPEDLGGNPVDPLTVYEIISRISAIDTSTAWVTAILLQGAGELATVLSPEEAGALFRERIPLRVLSLAPGTATRTTTGFRVSGRWNFLTGLRQADYVAVTFTVEGDDTGERRCALVPKQELELIDDWDVLGMRGTGSSSVRAEGVEIAARFVYDRFAPASYPRQNTMMARLGPTPYVLLANAGHPLGAARRALDFIIDAAPRIRRGARINSAPVPSLAEASWFQRELGELDTQWAAADSLVRATLTQVGARLTAGEPIELADTDRLQVASSFATKTALEIVTRVFRHLGAGAILDSHPVGRQLRDLNTLAAHGGLGEAGFESHGEFVLGLQDEGSRRLV